MESWNVTNHAAIRWLDRFEPGLADIHAARTSLNNLARGAVDTGQRRGGKRVYTHPDWPWVLFCVAHDFQQAVPTLVTVLDSPHNQMRSSNLIPETDRYTRGQR